jgi:putative Mn2+ efflux pump MntP
MTIDIRLPIGIFFFLTGVILTVFGAIESPARYLQSLGINLNFWWGIVLILFGIVMLLLGRRGTRQEASERASKAAEKPQEH